MSLINSKINKSVTFSQLGQTDTVYHFYTDSQVLESMSYQEAVNMVSVMKRLVKIVEIKPSKVDGAIRLSCIGDNLDVDPTGSMFISQFAGGGRVCFNGYLTTDSPEDFISECISRLDLA